MSLQKVETSEARARPRIRYFLIYLRKLLYISYLIKTISGTGLSKAGLMLPWTKCWHRRALPLILKLRPRRAPIMTFKPQRRLKSLLATLAPTPVSVGTLTLGSIQYEVPASQTPSRLPHSSYLLDTQDAYNLDNLQFILQKYLLGQDVFLVSQPGTYARRLALTFARCVRVHNATEPKLNPTSV